MAKNRQIRALILITVLLVSTQWKTYAQSYYLEDERTFYGGLIVGSNFAQIDGDNFAGYHKIGINGGGIVYAQLAPHIAGSMEILFSQKGSRSTLEQPSNTKQFIIRKYNIDMTYAEVPFQIHYFDKRKSHFGGGLSYSQLVSAKETVVTNNTNFNDTANFDRYPFKKFDINFVIGGNLHIVKGLYLNLRFAYSILPVRREINPEFGRAEQYSNMWTLRLMYLFD